MFGQPPINMERKYGGFKQPHKSGERMKFEDKVIYQIYPKSF